MRLSFRPTAHLIFVVLFLGLISFCDANEVCADSSEATLLRAEQGREIAQDGRFIAYANGTVLDTRTGLMWAASDNGENINWEDANKYCENYLGGWHEDWRMPTLDELAELYNTGPGYMQECCSSCSEIKITELIKLTCCCLWAAETDGSGAAHFVFREGFRGWNLQRDYVINRILPVRSAKSLKVVPPVSEEKTNMKPSVN